MLREPLFKAAKREKKSNPRDWCSFKANTTASDPGT